MLECTASQGPQEEIDIEIREMKWNQQIATLHRDDKCNTATQKSIRRVGKKLCPCPGSATIHYGIC
jgi:hypothetical protein